MFTFWWKPRCQGKTQCWNGLVHLISKPLRLHYPLFLCFLLIVTKESDNRLIWPQLFTSFLECFWENLLCSLLLLLLLIILLPIVVITNVIMPVILMMVVNKTFPENSGNVIFMSGKAYQLTPWWQSPSRALCGQCIYSCTPNINGLSWAWKANINEQFIYMGLFRSNLRT